MNVLRSCLFDVSARTPWTMGKLNFPSVRSSAKPLFSAYCKIIWASVKVRAMSGKFDTCLRTLKVHVIISDLKVYAKQIHKRYIVTMLT